MSSNIDRLKSQINKGSGLAIGSRFRVLLDNQDPLNILCEAVTWPGRQIMTTSNGIDMLDRKIAHGFSYENMEMSFYLTNDWAAWKYFQAWHNLIINRVEYLSAHTVNFKSEYQKDFIIDHLDRANNVRASVLIKNAFPVTMKAIDLSNEESEAIRISVTMAYDNFEDISGARLTNDPLKLKDISFRDVITDLRSFYETIKSTRIDIGDNIKRGVKDILLS